MQIVIQTAYHTACMTGTIGNVRTDQRITVQIKIARIQFLSFTILCPDSSVIFYSKNKLIVLIQIDSQFCFLQEYTRLFDLKFETLDNNSTMDGMFTDIVDDLDEFINGMIESVVQCFEGGLHDHVKIYANNT